MLNARNASDRQPAAADDHPSSACVGASDRAPMWWGARLELTQPHACGGRGVGPAPESVWIYVMGEPRHEPGPAPWPTHWGIVRGSPEEPMASLAGSAGWYLVAPHQCAWSLWLDLAINCSRGAAAAAALELLRRARADERRSEHVRQRRVYCDDSSAYDAFMRHVLEVPDPAALDPSKPPLTLLNGRDADQSRVTICQTVGGGLCLRFEPLDFGIPRPPDVEYRMDAGTVALARLELALLGGEVFDDPHSFVRVVLAQFDDLRQGLRWLREAGVWRDEASAPGAV